MTTMAGVLAYDPNKVKPGWIAFFIVMILVVATFLLWRSMNTQLGKIQVPPRASSGRDGRTRPPASLPDGGTPAPPAQAPPPGTQPPGDEEER